MLQLFANTLMGDHMYSAHSWENNLQQVQTQLSYKPKTILQTLIPVLKSTSHFARLEKKDQPKSSNIWEVIDSENCGYLIGKKVLFQKTVLVSMCPRVPKTAQICASSLLSWISINLGEIE